MKDSIDYLTPEEVQSIIDVAKDAHDRMLFLTMFLSGRRISEIIGIKNTKVKGLLIENINFKDNLIKWNILKKQPIKGNYTLEEKAILRSTREPYEVLIETSPTLINALKEYCGDKTSGQVFHVCRSGVHRKLQRCAKLAGINKRVHCHGFRHSFAIELARKARHPGDIEIIREQLEHSDIYMTRFYLKFSRSDKHELIDKLGLI